MSSGYTDSMMRLAQGQGPLTRGHVGGDAGKWLDAYGQNQQQSWSDYYDAYRKHFGEQNQPTGYKKPDGTGSTTQNQFLSSMYQRMLDEQNKSFQSQMDQYGQWMQNWQQQNQMQPGMMGGMMGGMPMQPQQQQGPGFDPASVQGMANADPAWHSSRSLHTSASGAPALGYMSGKERGDSRLLYDGGERPGYVAKNLFQGRADSPMIWALDPYQDHWNGYVDAYNANPNLTRGEWTGGGLPAAPSAAPVASHQAPAQYSQPAPAPAPAQSAFSSPAYLAANPDIAAAAQASGASPHEFAHMHYASYGQNEGRRW